MSCPPDDESSGYSYKVRSSGLADFSRLRMCSTGFESRAGERDGDVPRDQNPCMGGGEGGLPGGDYFKHVEKDTIYRGAFIANK